MFSKRQTAVENDNHQSAEFHSDEEIQRELGTSECCIREGFKRNREDVRLSEYSVDDFHYWKFVWKRHRNQQTWLCNLNVSVIHKIPRLFHPIVSVFLKCLKTTIFQCPTNGLDSTYNAPSITSSKVSNADFVPAQSKIVQIIVIAANHDANLSKCSGVTK